jgi:hypothetical protein
MATETRVSASGVKPITVTTVTEAAEYIGKVNAARQAAAIDAGRNQPRRLNPS